MKLHIDIKIDGKYYVQRTPMSKILEIDETNKIKKIYNDRYDLPIDVIDDLEKQRKIMQTPEKYFEITILNDDEVEIDFEENIDIKNLYIPEEIGRRKVVSLARIYHESKVERIVLPDTIKKLNAGNFSDMHLLNEVILPPTITILPYGCFGGCYNLSKINLDNIKEIQDDALRACFCISDLNLKNVEIIGKCAFFGDKNIKKLYLPNIKSIEMHAFAQLKQLEEIELGDNLKSIEQTVFLECTKIKSIVLPKNIQIIKQGAFQTCTSLTNINFPEGLIEIRKNAFTNTNLGPVLTFPSTIEKIEKNAFDYDKINAIYIPETVNAIFLEIDKTKVQALKDEVIEER